MRRGEKTHFMNENALRTGENVDATVAVVPACQMLREVTSVSKNTLLELSSLDFDLLGQQLRLN